LNLSPVSNPVAYLQVQPEDFQAHLLSLPQVTEVPIICEPKQVIEVLFKIVFLELNANT
jgi:hypothetical protein